MSIPKKKTSHSWMKAKKKKPDEESTLEYNARKGKKRYLGSGKEGGRKKKPSSTGTRHILDDLFPTPKGPRAKSRDRSWLESKNKNM